MIRRQILVLLAALGFFAATATVPAVAGPPKGDWTFLRKDAFLHYACKAKDGRNGKWQIRTATWINGNHDAIEHGIGAYAALARGSNRNLVAERSQTNWNGGYIRMRVSGARQTDRLWMQGAYYGPAEPWSDGYRVARITRC